MCEGRWVSYIFRYLNGVRCENAGFIKVQRLSCRNGDEARIQIGLKLMKEKACRCQVYLLYNENNVKHLTDIEFCAKERDTIMKRVEIPWDRPLDDVIPFDAYDGLFFVCDDGEILAGLWHEFILDVNNIRVICSNSKAYKDAPQPEMRTEPQPEMRTEPQPETRTEPQPETRTEPQPETHPEPHPEPQLEPHAEPQPEPHPEPQLEPHDEPQQEMGTKPQPEIHTEPQPEMQTEQRHEYENVKSNQKGMQEEIDIHDKSDEAVVEKVKYCENNNAVNESGMEEIQYDGMSICREMLRTYPRLPLLADSQFIECVKIVPQDIGKLAMGNWKLGVNSFLSHGYYHYKYIMLGKVKFEKNEIYVIGVPGVFTNKEKYLANMFGFSIFIPARKTRFLSGNFGYWISEVSRE